MLKPFRAIVVCTGLVLVFVCEGALACRCVSLQYTQWETILERNPVVFAGRALDRIEPPPELDYVDGEFVETTSTGDLVRYPFRVDAVFRGEVGERVEVLTVRSQTSCGYWFKQDREYLVFARRRESGELYTGTCTLTDPWELTLRERERLGSPRRSYRPLPPMPELERIDAWLTDPDRKRVRAAIAYWRDLDCGLELLYWRLDELPVGEITRQHLIRDIRAATPYLDAQWDGERLPLPVMLPPPESGTARPARTCPEKTRAWVERRLQALLERT